MAYTKAYQLDLKDRGFIEGITYTAEDGRSLCHYFGGIPFAEPPIGPFRWKRPRPLAACYRYGTRANPGHFVGGTALCPQTGARAADDLALQDENCLQLNVWIPIGEAPQGGWPVFFYIHGGFLQFGSANFFDVKELLSETECKCVVVTPAYRLNLFGFLASEELELEDSGGPLGFWDQRLALEWTYKNINYFGGSPSSIVVTGYSAGAHSAFHQLAHDLYQPKGIIKACITWSNGPGLPPKTASVAQQQFDSLLDELQIPLHLPASDKLAQLRRTSPAALVSASEKLALHEFRATIPTSTSKDSFIPRALHRDIENGTFAAKLKSRNTHLLVGDLRDENFVYANWRPPADSFDALRRRLYADYPVAAVNALLEKHYCIPDAKTGAPTLPKFLKPWFRDEDWNWKVAFGVIYADLQVHALERGVIYNLLQCDPALKEQIHRYHIEFRAKCWDGQYPKEWGATHTTDTVFWHGLPGKKLSDEEKVKLRPFLKPYYKFMLNAGVSVEEWGADAGKNEVRTLGADGAMYIKKEREEDFERGKVVWDIFMEAVRAEEQSATTKQSGSKL